jgi:O-antigen/teichoic acid export membrane protein
MLSKNSPPIAWHPRVRLWRHFSWTLPSVAVYAASQWLTLLILARWGTPDEVGRLGLALAVTAPVFMLANLRLRTLLATDHCRAHPFRDYLTLRLVGIAVAAGVLLTATQITRGREAAVAITALIVMAKAAESLSDLFHGLQQQHERLDRVSLSLLASGVASLAAFAMLYGWTRQLPWGVAGLLLARLAVLIGYDIPGALALRGSLDAATVGNPQRERAKEITGDAAVPRLRGGSQLSRNDSTGTASRRRSQTPPDGRPAGDPRTVTRTRFLAGIGDGGGVAALWWQALPLGVTSLLLSLNSNTPRYLLAYHCGTHELGIFCSLAAIMAAGTLALRAVEQPSSPRLACYYQSGNLQAFWRLFSWLLAGLLGSGFAALLLSLLVGGPALRVALTPEYATYDHVLAVIVLAAIAAHVAGLLETTLIAARVTTVHLPLHVCTAVVCLAVGHWLIPAHGVWGAAWALAVCRLPYIAGAVFLLRRLSHRGADALLKSPEVVTG